MQGHDGPAQNTYLSANNDATDPFPSGYFPTNTLFNQCKRLDMCMVFYRDGAIE
jgi:hypothetical protein